MGAVEYIVFYKYVHPTIKKPVTNLTTDVYDTDTRFVKAYSASETVAASQDILDAQAADNSKYDMLFIYDGIMQINTVLSSKLPSSNMPTIYNEKFERCKGEAWFIASYHASLQSALNAAKTLVLSLGKENVKVMKNAALDVFVELE